MTLPYHPKRGEILICDLDTGFQPPEMGKRRPVVVVSKRESHGRGLCTVVPLSTTESHTPKWHHPLPHVQVPGWQPAGVMWAKCDLPITVAFGRLNKPYRRTRHGRAFVEVMLVDVDMAAIDACLRSYLGL